MSRWQPLVDSTPSQLDAYRLSTREGPAELRVFTLRLAALVGIDDLASLEADAQTVAAKVEASIRNDREGKALADALLREVES